MGNTLFIGDFPIKTPISSGFPIATVWFPEGSKGEMVLSNDGFLVYFCQIYTKTFHTMLCSMIMIIFHDHDHISSISTSAKYIQRPISLIQMVFFKATSWLVKKNERLPTHLVGDPGGPVSKPRDQVFIDFPHAPCEQRPRMARYYYFFFCL